MSQPIYEIVVFDVISRDEAMAARRQAMQAVRAFPGFRRYRALSAASGAPVFADLIEWSDVASAQAAAKAVKSDPRFGGMVSSIFGIQSIGHFVLDEDSAESDFLAAAPAARETAA